MLRLRFLGPLEVCFDERPVKFATKKSALLLAYLVTFRDRAHPRETLAGLFWGEASEKSAHNSLRYALTVLRKVLPSAEGSLPYLIATGGSLRFNEKAPFELDALTLEATLHAAKQQDPLSESTVRSLETALAFYRGPFLEGFFDDWIVQEQMHWQDRFLEGVVWLSQFYERRGDQAKNIELCRNGLRFCPLHEPLCRALMHAYVLAGDRNAALSQYEALAQALKAETELEPLPETQALYKEIVAHRGGPPRRMAHAPRAILPQERYGFVGREDLLEQLSARWKRVQDGERLALLIRGEPGVGKSRFLSEAIRILQAEGHVCLRSDCLPTSPAPFDPIIQALREGLRDAKDLLTGLPRYLQAELQNLIPDWGSPEYATSISSPDQIQARRFQAFCGLIQQLAQRRPVCLVLDDLHWADESTLQWIEYAFRRLQKTPLLLLGSYRDEEVTEEHPLSALTADLGAQGVLEEWELPPLSLVQSAQLLSQVLQRPLSDHDELAEVSLHLTGGNPFYLCALATGLNESGLVQTVSKEGADWKARLVSYVPQTIQAALGERLRRLSSRGRKLLEVGSVLGHRWSFSLAAIVSGQRRPYLIEAVKELLGARLLVDQGEQYAFQHDLVREFIYRHLPHAQRQYLHGKTAQTLENQTALTVTAPAILAWHFELAHRPGKAIHYLLMAATQSVQNYALKEALNYLQRAEDQVKKLLESKTSKTVPYESQIHAKRAAIYDLLGDREKQLSAINSLERFAKASGDTQAHLHAHLHRGHWARVTGQFNEALEEANKMRALAQQEADLLYEAVALRMRSLAHESFGEYEQALRDSRQAEELYPSLPSVVSSLTMLDHTEVLYSYMGQFDKALASYEGKLKGAQAVSDPAAQMNLFWNLAICLENLGHYTEALTNYHKARELGQQMGDRWAEGALLCNMGSALWGAGSLEEGLARFAQALPIIKEIGHTRAELAIMVNMGTVYGDLGWYDQALRCFDSTLEMIQDKKLKDLEIEVFWRKSEVLLKLGQCPSALELSSRAMKLIEGGASLQNLVRAYFRHAQALEANGEQEASRSFLKRAYEELMRRAQCIEREDLREMFLSNIRDHRSLITAWRAAQKNTA